MSTNCISGDPLLAVHRDVCTSSAVLKRSPMASTTSSAGLHISTPLTLWNDPSVLTAVPITVENDQQTSHLSPKASGTLHIHLYLEPMANQQHAEQSRRRSAGSGPGSPASTQADGIGGRKSTSGERPVDFRFLNFSNPQEAKNAQTRKSVRSHVTTGQHRNARKAAAESAKQSRKGSQPSSATVSDVDTDSPDASSPTTPPIGAQLSRLNPLDLYPESWHSSLRPVMDHYINTMSVDVPETDPSIREFIRTQFMNLIFSDAASLHTLILLAAAHYSKVRGQPSHSIDILQLRGMAIQEINRALVDYQPSGRATSDRMIAAVGKMATYELLFGQRDAFHTHMTGLQRLVAMRGGLQTLGLNGFLERTLLWLDVNAAQITGSPNLYFPPSTYPSSRGHPSPDRRLFVMGLS